MIANFLDKLKKYGLEYFGRYYSFYWGIVTDNNDPENLNRVRFECPELKLKPDYWALPGIGVSNGHGNRILPSVGDSIRLSYKNGDLRQAVWDYGVTPKGQQITEADSINKQVFKSVSGVLVIIDDSTKSYTIQTPDGLTVALKNGIIELSKGGTTEQSVKGQTLQAQLNTDKAKLDALIQAIIAAPVIPTDGGASFKASIIAAISAVPSADYTSILSNVLKNE